MEVRVEMELDLDEGVFVVGWEESIVEGDEEEIRYEDGVDRNGDRDRRGIVRFDLFKKESLYIYF